MSSKLPRKREAPAERVVDNRHSFELKPDNAEVVAILAAHIDGPYRFAHHALIPYVRVGPAQPDQSIRIQHGDQLRLAAAGPKTLHGMQETIDFSVMFQPGVVLKEVVGRDEQLRANRLLKQCEDHVMLPTFDEKDTKGLPFRQGGQTLAVPGPPEAPSGESPQAHASRRVQETARELNDALRYATHVGLSCLVILRDDGALPQISVENRGSQKKA